MSSFKEIEQAINEINSALKNNGCNNTGEVPNWKQFMFEFSLACKFNKRADNYLDRAFSHYENAQREIREHYDSFPLTMLSDLDKKLQELRQELSDSNAKTSTPSYQ